MRDSKRYRTNSTPMQHKKAGVLHCKLPQLNRKEPTMAYSTTPNLPTPNPRLRMISSCCCSRIGFASSVRSQKKIPSVLFFLRSLRRTRDYA